MTPRRFSALALAAVIAAVTAGAAARAEGPDTTTDIRCLVVAGAFAQKDDPKLKQIGATAFVYFWGRLQGRGDMAGLSDRVKQEIGRMSPDDIQAQAPLCGKMLTDTGDAIQALGRDIDAAGAH